MRCTLGLWDESVPGIYFDREGVTNYARIQQSLMKDFPVGEAGLTNWNRIIDTIKKLGNGKPYDCLIGVSGGTDSSYLLHLAKEYGLRPLAVNLDNGWNSDIAVKNIKKVTTALGIDLETYVIEYEEIKDLLRTYIRALLPWVDAPTDMAIQSVLYKIARREKVKYILIGTDFRSEGKQPSEWTYSDQRMLRHLHKKHGNVRLKTYPRLSLFQLLYLGYVLRVKLISPFNYLVYDKMSARELLIEKYQWEYYGEHHHENLFTKWAIGYWMYEKFGIDKRIITYSAQVLNGKMKREDALAILEKKPFDTDNIEKETSYTLKKLEISAEEFETIWKSPNRSFLDYPSYYSYIYKFAGLIAPVVRFIVPIKPKIFYEIEERNRFVAESSVKEYKICSRCILDTSVSDIWFDEKEECKYCIIHDEMERAHPLGPQLEGELNRLTEKIKKARGKKKYDCIAGVSGGRDSTYTLYTAVKLGLRPLAVHFDNGWNSDISVQNIKKACEILKVDLHTIVADWEEFKDLQLSFLKASTPDADVPTDYAIYSVLYHVASKEGIRYILNGHSFRTEGTSPISWTYMDPLYVRSVHKRFGKIKKFRSFPHMTLFKLQYYIWVKRIREIRLMEFIDYRKKDVDRILAGELGWQYYGGHHHENLYTRFFQSYYLPAKFTIDKRKTELSALVRSGQITRDEALHEISQSDYEHDEKTVTYAINKLGLSRAEFDEIMNRPVKSHNDYPTYLPLIRLLRFPIRIAARLRLVPHILYLKYAS